jgi:vanillate O-demethylase ferredoxin subunit
MFQVAIRGMWLDCPRVVCVELVAADGARLPDFVAGAHVDVQLTNGQVRSYSLVGRSADGLGYRIGVKREDASRGGSAWLHDVARLGMRLDISAPKGEFQLIEDALVSVFIAGGIGITPLLPMMARLNEIGRPWQLHYAASQPSEMAFRPLIGDLAGQGGQVHTYFSDGSTPRMDIEALVRSADEQAHLYCCGPARMIDAYVRACASHPAATVHFERFAAEQAAATEGGFTLELARDGRKLAVPAGKTILDVLLDAGVEMPYSCGQGVCGSCLTRVLAGEPDHRDCFLTEGERAANESMLVCCSGARSASLVIDL